jgi:hypothetical protein
VTKELSMRALVTQNRDPAEVAAEARRLSTWARVVLIPVAVIGAVLSFKSLYAAATPTFGPYLSAGFPLLVDLLILGASLQYVAGAKVGRPMSGWRLTAHAGVAGTLILTALAAERLGEVPWHITAPAVWAVLVELTAKQVLGEWKATHAAVHDRISLALWLTAPVESIRTRLLMLRTGISDARDARIAVGIHAAAREALRLALPDRHGRSVRRILARQLRAGSLTPTAILAPLGWSGAPPVVSGSHPESILRAVLQGVLHEHDERVRVSGSPSQGRRSEPDLTTEPLTAEPPAAEPLTVEPPAAEPPATEPLTVEPPSAEPPAVEPPAAEPPAAEPLTVEPPSVEPPAAEPPAPRGRRRARRTAMEDCPVHDPELWDWYVKQRQDGISPAEKDVADEFDVPRSTAGRWRRACDSAYTARQVSEEAAAVSWPAQLSTVPAPSQERPNEVDSPAEPRSAVAVG